MKKRIVIASIMGLILALAMGSTALANHTPRDTHHHHIILPNGDCLDIVAIHKAGVKSSVLQHGECPPPPP